MPCLSPRELPEWVRSGGGRGFRADWERSCLPFLCRRMCIPERQLCCVVQSIGLIDDGAEDDERGERRAVKALRSASARCFSQPSLSLLALWLGTVCASLLTRAAGYLGDRRHDAYGLAERATFGAQSLVRDRRQKNAIASGPSPFLSPCGEGGFGLSCPATSAACDARQVLPPHERSTICLAVERPLRVGEARDGGRFVWASFRSLSHPPGASHPSPASPLRTLPQTLLQTLL